jgi:hypothetical protein
MNFFTYCQFYIYAFIVFASFSTQAAREKQTVKLIVFVHGTLFTDSVQRKNPLWTQDQVLLVDEGLQEIPAEKIQACKKGLLSQDDSRTACHHLIMAYDAVDRKMNSHQDIHIYAAYGWTGSLDAEQRKQAGLRFYNELCTMRDHYQQLYQVTPEIIIHTHSHGGNVALWLPYGENKAKRDLKVQLLTMFGTPFQQETAQFIESPLFNAIISCYSDGDWVPTLDTISTQSGISYKKISEVINISSFVQKNPSLLRCDMRLLFNFSTTVVNHHNMWMLGRSISSFTHLKPYPILVLAPVMATQLAEHPTLTGCNFCIHASDHTLIAHLSTDFKNPFDSFTASPNLYNVLLPLRSITRKRWHPEDTYTSVIFNYKNFTFFKQKLFGS